MATKNTDDQHKFSHGPQAKREDKLFRLLRISFLGHLLWLIGAIVVTTAIAIKPDRVVVAEKDTGRIVGEYRTTAYRTQDELLAAAAKFAEYQLSLNSRTVYDDFQAALNMMSNELVEKRTQFYERTNLPKTIERGNTRSYLKFNEMKIVHTDGPFAKAELAGEIISDQLRDNPLPKKAKSSEDEVKLMRNKLPFRIVIDLEMVPITTFNTMGVRVVGFYEAE